MANTLNTIGTISGILKILSLDEIQHMLRVGDLADLFAETLKTSVLVNTQGDEHRLWGKAAFYHDIGKAWIPSEILTKPERLTEGETIIIRNHPLFAQELFVKVNHGVITGITDELLPLAAHAAIYSS